MAAVVRRTTPSHRGREGHVLGGVGHEGLGKGLVLTAGGHVEAVDLITVPALGGERLFCSQFVIEAFNRAGKPLTSAKPQWVDPSDILHMREDDIATISPVAKLQYIGHLQCSPSLWNASCQANKQAPASSPPAQNNFQAAATPPA